MDVDGFVADCTTGDVDARLFCVVFIFFSLYLWEVISSPMTKEFMLFGEAKILG